MATPYNPSLHEEPQSQKAIIIAPRADESLFGWLEGTGRFLADDKFGSRADDELEAILDTSSSYTSDTVEEEEDDDDDED